MSTAQVPRRAGPVTSFALDLADRKCVRCRDGWLRVEDQRGRALVRCPSCGATFPRLFLFNRKGWGIE
jgi:hypothetical protein